jgi:hypothetical protein
MRKKFQTPQPGTTLTCRPASTSVTHNEACMKLRRLHPRCERPSCPTLSTPSSSISSNGSARAHAPIAKSSRPGGRRVRAWRFGKPLRNVASLPANLHRKAAPELRFPPPGQSTCAGIAAPSPTPTLKPLRRHAENGRSGLSLDKRDTSAKTEHPRREAERDRGGDRRLCRQDAQGPTRRPDLLDRDYPGGASGGGKLPSAPNIAVFSASSSSGAPRSSPNRTLG